MTDGQDTPCTPYKLKGTEYGLEGGGGGRMSRQMRRFQYDAGHDRRDFGLRPQSLGTITQQNASSFRVKRIFATHPRQRNEMSAFVDGIDTNAANFTFWSLC